MAGILLCVNFWSMASGQEKTVSLDVKDKALREVLALIREQVDARFIYSEVEIQKAKPVTAKFEGLSLDEALKRVLEGQPFTHEIQGDIVVIKPVRQPKADKPVEKRTVKGKVTDENGQPVPGANVYLKGSTIGVIVITTKRAKEGKTQISASATWTIHPYNYYTGHLTNSADIIALQRKWAAENPELNNGIDRAQAEADNLRNNYAWPSKGIDILLDLYTNQLSEADANAQLDELASRGFAYYDDVEKYAKRNSFYQQYYLSVGKATERNNFTFSASYRNNKEEDIYTKDDQIGLNLQNSMQITDWLKADLGMYVNFRNGVNQTYDLLNSYSAGFTAMPYDRLVNEDGSHVSWTSQYSQTVRDNIGNYGLYDVTVTPLDELGRCLEKSRDFMARMSGKLEVKLLPWLSYNAQYQL